MKIKDIKWSHPYTIIVKEELNNGQDSGAYHNMRMWVGNDGGADMVQGHLIEEIGEEELQVAYELGDFIDEFVCFEQEDIDEERVMILDEEDKRYGRVGRLRRRLYL